MEKGYCRLAIPTIQTDSIVDGEGIRSVIWFQGCGHACPECHNPETWDFEAGEVVSLEDLKHQIDELEFQSGVTFSGGDPMYQIDALIELAKYVKEKGMNVWVYTGFEYDDLVKMAEKNNKYREVLDYIDVLVDGPFKIALKSFDCAFRGSSNQRLIDVKKTLENNKVITLEKYK
mgnify:CR=1 FL=1